MITNKKITTFFEYWHSKIYNYFYIKEAKINHPEDEVLNIKNLSVSFKTKNGTLHAVRDISFKLKKGEIIGIVGESGSGKSVTVKSLLGFNDNSIMSADLLDFKGIDLTSVSKHNWKYIRGCQIAYIPQDPLLSLNPTKKIGAQIIEAILMSQKRKFQNLILKEKQYLKNLKITYQKKIKKLKKELDSVEFINITKDLKKEFQKNYSIANINAQKNITKQKNKYKHNTSKKIVKKTLDDILNFIGIKNPKDRIKDYPHEFSGGMRQRIVIAMAIVAEPSLIIADEPTTALDVTIQAKVLDLIKKLRDRFEIAVIFISHNIALVANFCDFLYVMYAGKVVESGRIYDIFTNPRHPYTWALICSIPDMKNTQKLIPIPGTPPNLYLPPIGDAFAPRNKYAVAIDFEQEPPMFTISPTHKAATWLLHPDSPFKEIPNEVLEKLNDSKKSLNQFIEK